MTIEQMSVERARGESGFTLVELSLTTAVFLTVLALVTPSFLVATDSAARTQALTVADSAVRPALIELTNQIGSASVMYSPCPSSGSTNYADTHAGAIPSCTAGSDAGFAVLMYTGGSSGGRCVQWRVYPSPSNSVYPGNSSASLLQARSWTSSSTKPWLNQASNVVLLNSSSQPPFTLTGVTDSILKIDLWVSAGAKSPTVEIKTQVAIQGIAHPSETCTSVPS